MRTLLPRLIAVLILTGLVNAQGPDKIRRLPLSGAPNFRDLGGYATTDGRHTRWGLVYRSGALSQLTAKDYEYLARLGITAVCDLRRDDERKVAPTHWQGANPPEILSMPTPPRFGPPTRELLLKGISETEMKARMRAVYEQMVVAYAPGFRATLHRILKAEGPTLYHCSAGKDRTGVFSALLLSLLGVPRETVFEDYLLSDVYVDTTQQVDAMVRELNASRAGVRAALTADYKSTEGKLTCAAAISCFFVADIASMIFGEPSELGSLCPKLQGQRRTWLLFIALLELVF